MGFPKIIRAFQSYSIDVVAGSLATGLFAVKWCNASMPTAWWFVLAVAVWIIYTSDHIIDSFSKKETSLIYRHKIHYVFKNRFIAIGILLGIPALVLSFVYLDEKTLVAGTILGFTVIIYLMAIVISSKKFKYFFKEIFVALIYVAGIWLSPLINSQYIDIASTTALLIVFIILVIAEELTAAIYESELDKADNQPSFCVQYGIRTTRKIVFIALSIALAISMYFIVTLNIPQRRYFFVIIVVMDILLTVLLLFQKYFKKNQRYRIFGETVFWLPAIIAFTT